MKLLVADGRVRCLHLAVAASLMFACYYQATPKASSDSPPSFNALDKTVLQSLRTQHIVQSYRWEPGNGETLLCLVRFFESDLKWLGPGVRLTILDESGATLYEAYHSEVSRVYSARILGDEHLQFVVEANDGGNTTSFVQILNYDKGKIVTLMDESENDYDIACEVRPVFRGNINPAKAPFEVFLTRGVGIASPAEKTTSVYRYKNGSYKLAGEFLQQELDNYIEKLLVRN